MNIPKEVKTLIDLKEFKRGMLGLLKVLAQESLEHQRLDHYSLYSTMKSFVAQFDIASVDMVKLGDSDEEDIARMILNFPNDDS